MVRYTKEKVSKAIQSMEQLFEVENKQREKMLEMFRSLIRVERACDKEFWLDKIKWKKLPLKEKQKIFHNEKCVKYSSSGSIFQDIKDFEFFARKQWENDRKRLLKRGEISS